MEFEPDLQHELEKIAAVEEAERIMLGERGNIKTPSIKNKNTQKISVSKEIGLQPYLIFSAGFIAIFTAASIWWALHKANQLDASYQAPVSITRDVNHVQVLPRTQIIVDVRTPTATQVTPEVSNPPTPDIHPK